MENTRPTQAQRVLDYMQVHGGITQLEALNELGVLRLASRISELKRNGFMIASEFKTVRNRFDEECRVKRYSLEVQHEGTN